MYNQRLVACDPQGVTRLPSLLSYLLAVMRVSLTPLILAGMTAIVSASPFALKVN